MRLDKYLHDLGFGSRKEIDKLLRSEKVTVDGAIAKKSAMAVDEESVVEVMGERLSYEPIVWLMLNKPMDCVSAVRDRNFETVMDYIPERYARMNVVPVGRLDKDTTGLLLLTNDGKAAHRLTSPKHQVEKVYVIDYEETLVPDAVARAAQGIDLGDFVSAPAKLECLEEGQARLTITEGKFHQVKRMMHELGGVVVGLHREAIGALALDEDLAEGEWRLLTQEEIESLTK